jgi:hypothetical protein
MCVALGRGFKAMGGKGLWGEGGRGRKGETGGGVLREGLGTTKLGG